MSPLPAILTSAYRVVLLALLTWREARGETRGARVQVAWTVRNRVENPKWWGTDYISVITKKWQYSSIASPRDPQLILYPQENDHVFLECLEIANTVISSSSGEEIAPFPEADSYYDDSIAPPAWATPDKMVGRIGRLAFYNIDGSSQD